MGYLLRSGPLDKLSYFSLGNWKQWVSNIDPTTFLTSLGLSDFNDKIQLAKQMLLSISINASMTLKGHANV